MFTALLAAVLIQQVPPVHPTDTTLGQPRMPSATSLVLFREPGLEGGQLLVVERLQNLSASFETRSLRVNGGAWEVCDQSNFRGACRIVDGQVFNLRSGIGISHIRSARPVA